MLRFDDSRAPLYCYWFDEPGSVEDYDKLMSLIDEVLERDEPYAIYVNGEQGVVPEARVLRRVAAWLKRWREVMDRNAIATATVVRNPVKRAVVRTILWMEPSPVEFQVFEEEHAAIAWLERKLQSDARV